MQPAAEGGSHHALPRRSGQNNENGLKVYPNPFSDKVTFEFISPFDVNARIDIYDLTGRLVHTLIDNQIKAGEIYNAEFIPKATVNSIYLYRVTLGKEVFNGKVMFKK